MPVSASRPRPSPPKSELAPPRYEAVLFDALGTLVRLEPPWPLLQSLLSSRHGVEISEDEARDAMRAEIGYYIEHHTEGRDRESLVELRSRCAGVLAGALPETGLSGEQLTEVLLESLRFTPLPDAAPVLGALRAAGIRTAVVSNWDCSLDDVLAGLGLGGLLNTVVTSAVAGARKPDPEIFRIALARLRCAPERALFVGDSLEVDIAGGQAAGVRSLLLDRGAGAADPGEVERISTLDNLPALAAGSPIV
jgi:putative hydrolase of the HAD superfamily